MLTRCAEALRCEARQVARSARQCFGALIRVNGPPCSAAQAEGCKIDSPFRKNEAGLHPERTRKRRKIVRGAHESVQKHNAGLHRHEPSHGSDALPAAPSEVSSWHETCGRQFVASPVVRGRYRARMGAAGESGRNQATWSKASSRRALDSVVRFTDPGERAALDLIREEIRKKPILDVGVGTGRTIPLLSPLTADYRALDYLPAMVEASRRRYPGVRIDLGDARDLSDPPPVSWTPPKARRCARSCSWRRGKEGSSRRSSRPTQ